MRKARYTMKKILCLTLAVLTACSTSVFAAKKNTKKVKIGIAKIVQHPALDAAEQGVIDAIKAAGIDAQFDQQNANGDVGTAAQIANQFKTEKVTVAVGIATPVAVALATTLKTTPVVFSAVTDPVGAGLVTTTAHGDKYVTGMSDAIPTVQHIKLFAEVAKIKTLGYIYTSNEANSISAIELVKQGCKEAGITLVTQSISKSDEVKQAAEAIINRVDGIYLTTDNTVFSAISSLIEVFGKAKKPIFSGDVTAAKEGGIFMASGFNYYKAGRATGELVVQILKGKKCSEIPVRFMTEPSDSDFLIDLDNAAACGITVDKKYTDMANMIFENGTLSEKK